MADIEQVVVEEGVITSSSITSTLSSSSSNLPSSSSSSSSSPYHFQMTDLSWPLLKSLNAGASCRRRLRYTCSDVSPNVTPVLEAPARYLALGTTSGSVHVFQYFGDAADCDGSSMPLEKSVKGGAKAPMDANNSQSFSSSSTSPANIQHYLTIIHEDLIGPVTSVAFAPVQLVVSRAVDDQINNGSNLSTSTSLSSSDDSSNSDLDSSSTDHISSPVSNGHQNGYHQNGHRDHHHQSPANSTSTHSLYNLVLAIGSSKGSLLIVDIDLQFQQQQQHEQQKKKLNKSTSSSFFNNFNSSNFAATRRWAVTYQSNSFTAGQAISLLRWDNSSRLFIGDTTGKLFVLHDVEEMKYLMLHSAPKMLLHILPPTPGDTTTSDAFPDGSTSQSSSSSSSSSSPVATIHQVDVAERQLLVSTTEPRVYLYNLDDEGLLLPVGGAKTTTTSSTTSTSSNLGNKKGKKSARKSAGESGAGHCSGVTALATYRLLELSHFNQQQNFDEDSSSGSDFEADPSNFYRRSNYLQKSQLSSPSPPVKAYRLVSTECTFYATRPKCRLWVVDHQGAVQFTQQYAELVKLEVGVGESSKPGDDTSSPSRQNENGLASPKPVQKRKKKSDVLPSTSLPVHNFGKLYSMYWRHRSRADSGGKNDEDLLADSLTVYSYIVTYSTTNNQSQHPRLFVIDPNLQVILATSPPIEGTIEEVKCVGNDVFVSYRTEPTASLQLVALTLHFKPILQKSTSTSSSTSESTATTTSSLLNGDQVEQELMSDSRKSTLVSDQPVVVDDHHQPPSTVDGLDVAAIDEVLTDAAKVDGIADNEGNEGGEIPQTNLDIDSKSEKFQEELPLSPLPVQPRTSPFTLRYYLLLLRYSIMEQSVNRVGQQALLRLQKLAEAGSELPVNKRKETLESASSQQLLGRRSTSGTTSTAPLSLVKLKPFTEQPLDTKAKSASSSKSAAGGVGKVVDLRQANCARCHQSILCSQPPESGHHQQQQRPKIKMYRSCEHIYHSACLHQPPTAISYKAANLGGGGRCSLCSSSGHRFLN